MAIKIAIANQKGGVGKTTTAINLADALSHFQYKVLFIDLDPQHNSTSTYGAEIDGVNTIVDVLKKDCTAKEAVQTTPLGDIIAGDGLLAIEENTFNAKKAREGLLKKQIAELDDEYDFIIMDTPPNLGIYMINALTAADGCIIPIKAEQYAVDGLSLLIDTVNEVIEVLNEDLKIYGVLMTSYDSRNSLDVGIKEVLPEVGDQKGFKTFDTQIRISQDVKKAQAIRNTYDDEGNVIVANRSLFENFKNSNAAIDYVKFTKELLEVING
ncbi:ParA family protein [Butyrivibrio sp. XPD2002]|uniref:ParA family protein n=1 Tax=Butyrivibrio sp. XPD2002 TaxID=1280665 RepID=UPI000412F6F8|nr:AAA family ATPase [Butyrivibrio sp. XPD2002]